MKTLNDIKSLYRENKSCDAWGDAISFAFILCDVLYSRDEHDIPELMHYYPSIMGVELDEDCYITQELLKYETDTLEEFGRILNRLIDILKKQGRDY